MIRATWKPRFDKSRAMPNDFPMPKESFIRCSPKQDTLESAITVTINRFSAESGSDTPDFILGAYLMDCLNAFNRASVWRGKWYSAEGVPENERESAPIDSVGGNS